MPQHFDTKENPTTPQAPMTPTVQAPSTLGQIKDVGDRRTPDPSNTAADTSSPPPPIQNVQKGVSIVPSGGGTTAPGAAPGAFKGSGGFKSA